MFLILKLISSLLCLIIFGVINCGGRDTQTQPSSNYKKKRSKKSKEHKNRTKTDHDKKSENEDNVDANAAGKDVFKRPEVLGMATANDPKYATLKKLDVDKLLGSGENKTPVQNNPM